MQSELVEVWNLISDIFNCTVRVMNGWRILGELEIWHVVYHGANVLQDGLTCQLCRAHNGEMYERRGKYITYDWVQDVF